MGLAGSSTEHGLHQCLNSSLGSASPSCGLSFQPCNWALILLESLLVYSISHCSFGLIWSYLAGEG